MSYKTNDPGKVRLPVLPSEFRNQKPVIDTERSGTILDGYMTIHWKYIFEKFGELRKGDGKPLISKQFINWGSQDHNNYLTLELAPDVRSVELGPLNPDHMYFVYVDVSFEGSPKTVEKSLNYFIEKDQLQMFKDESRRPFKLKNVVCRPDSHDRNVFCQYKASF